MSEWVMMMMLGTAWGLEVWLSTISRLDYGGGKGTVRPSLSLSLNLWSFPRNRENWLTCSIRSHYKQQQQPGFTCPPGGRGWWNPCIHPKVPPTTTSLFPTRSDSPSSPRICIGKTNPGHLLTGHGSGGSPSQTSSPDDVRYLPTCTYLHTCTLPTMDGLYRYRYRYIPPPDEESRVEMMGRGEKMREDERWWGEKRRGEEKRRGHEEEEKSGQNKQQSVLHNLFFFFFLDDIPEDRRKTKDRAGIRPIYIYIPPALKKKNKKGLARFSYLTFTFT